MFVYLIEMEGGWFKIGRSRCPADRVNQLSTALPFDLTLRHVVADLTVGHRVEKFLHRRFDAVRGRGEWFRLTDDDAAWVESLTAADAKKLVRQAARQMRAEKAKQEKVKAAMRAEKFKTVSLPDDLVYMAKCLAAHTHGLTPRKVMADILRGPLETAYRARIEQMKEESAAKGHPVADDDEVESAAEIGGEG